MKTADLFDEAFIWAMRFVQKDWGVSHSQDVAEYLQLPYKLVLSKARKMIDQGKIEGCSCGCRGDWREKLYDPR